MSRYHQGREIAIEAVSLDEKLHFQAMIYSTTATEDEDGDRVYLRDKLEFSGPLLNTYGEARAWALGKLAK